MAQNKLKDHLIEDLINDARNITPTFREAAILASLDESNVTKFVPDKVQAIPEENEEDVTGTISSEGTQSPVVEEKKTEEKEEEIAENKTLPDEKKEATSTYVLAINDSLSDGKRPQEETLNNKEEPDGNSRADKKVVYAINSFEDFDKKQETLEEKKVDQKEEVKKTVMKIKGTVTETAGGAGNTKVPGKFEVYPEDDQFKYRLKANNGEILVVSYGYTTRDGAHSGIETLKKNLEGGIVSYITDKNNRSQWRLSTSNDSRIIALGETYPTLSGAQSAFVSAQKFGKTENIVDLDEIPASERREWEFTCEMMGEKENGTIEIYDDGGKFRARLKANNQEILFVTSQSYATKASLRSSLDNIKSKLNANAFHISKDKQGRYQFIMESGSGFVYLVGESYGTASAAKSAAASVLAFINKANINDLTLKSSNVEVELTGVKK